MPEPMSIGDRITKYGSVAPTNREQRPLLPLITTPGWMSNAKCVTSKNPDKFVPSKRPASGPPPECAPCVVRSLCLQRGHDMGAQGWWGGHWLTGRKQK